MSDLTEFLLARIADDEDAARALKAHDLPRLIESPAKYVSRFDPARILAECEAKRLLLAEHPEVKIQGYESKAGCCDTCEAAPDWPCTTIRAMAAIYADHPDYREEWKP